MDEVANTQREWPRTSELLGRVNLWAKPLLDDPEFRAFNRRKIQSALDLYDDVPRELREDFPMPPALSQQYDAVMGFYYLHSACDRLQGMHLYFRRFPFRPDEMPKVEHLQNMFDMFVGCFYVVLQRLQFYLNALKPLVDAQPDIAGLVKRYRREFENELRPRHQTTHERPYDDIVFDRLFFSEFMGGHGDREHWKREHLALYRRETRRWAALAQRRSRAVLNYLEAVAAFTLEHAIFLKSAEPAE